jgi:hypothetical protein
MIASPLRQRLHTMLVPAAKVVIPLLQPRLEVSRPLVAECEALLERLQLLVVLTDTRGVYPLMQAKQLDENRLAYARLKERVEAYVAVDEEIIAIARSLLDAMPVTYLVPHLPPVDELLRDDSGIQFNIKNAFQCVDPFRVEDLFGIVNAHDRILRCLARELSGAVRLAAFSAEPEKHSDLLQ